MPKAFQYRIYPTKAQRTLLRSLLEECRWVYNQTLAMRKDAWETEKKCIGWHETKRQLPKWKAERTSLSMVHSQVLQNVTMRVDLAFKAFFRRVKVGEEREEPGYPRFKGRGRYDSITYPQYGNGVILEDNVLALSKIGNIQVKMHRPLEGKPKTVTVRCAGSTDKWYVSISCEVESPIYESNGKPAIGIDLGLTSFATFSTGEKVDNPKFMKRDEKDLKQAHKRLSREKKGTPNRAKRRKVLSTVYERISNRRKDFAHKLSHSLVHSYGVICFEKLDIKDMQNGNFRTMNRSISDTAWNQLIQFTTYKAEGAGSRVILVDPRNTTKRCSRCGVLVPKSLSVRVHNCPCCNLVLDRDQNAAINVLALGLQSIGIKSVEAQVF